MMFAAVRAAGVGFALLAQNFWALGATSTINLTVCSLPSAPTIVSPTDGTSTADNAVVVTGIAEANSNVFIYRNGAENASTTASGDGSYSVSIPLVTGNNAIYAQARNNCGGGANSATVNVTRTSSDPEPPPPDGGGEDSTGGGTTGGSTGGSTTTETETEGEVTPTAEEEEPSLDFLQILEPKDGYETSNPAVWLRGLAEAGVRVKIFRDNNQVASVTTDDEGEFALSVSLQSGANVIKVSYTTSEGESVSKSITVHYQPAESLSFFGTIGRAFKEAGLAVLGALQGPGILVLLVLAPMLWFIFRRRRAA